MTTDNSIDIIYQDEALLIVDKPAKLLSVPGRGPDKQDCLISRLISQGYSDALIVHRLDYATSGVMVVARSKPMHKALSILFQNREISKSYQAVVWGKMKAAQGTINQPLRCDWENRPLQIVDYEWGKNAITHWQVTEQTENASRIMLYPETGRSHQLRVHLQWFEHPICGDQFYAFGDALNHSPRLCLHAQTLGFIHPTTNQEMAFEIPCPF
jgi:tRNA pseudouridine32 synthase/23S rRNA pseudouridine746 synthase